MAATLTKRHIPILLSGVAFALIWAIAAVNGPLISLAGTPYDYAQAALHLSHGEGYTNCFGYPVPWYPPGYSALLAVPMALGSTLIQATVLVAAVCAAVLVFSVAWTLSQLVRRTELVILGTALIVCNPVMIRWLLELIADAVHATAVIACLAALAAFARSGKWWAFTIAVAAAIAATQFRFIGVALLPVACLFLLFTGPAATFLRRFRDSAFFGTLTVLPIALFAYYNASVTGTAGGSRPITLTAPLTHLYVLLEDLSRWAFSAITLGNYDLVSTEVRLTVFVIAALAGSVFIARLIQKEEDLAARRDVVLYLSYSIGYLLFMIVLASVIPLDDLGGRFILPVLPPLMIVGVFFLDRIVAAGSQHNHLVRPAAALLLFGVLAVPGSTIVMLLSGQKTFAFNTSASPHVVADPLLDDVKRANNVGTLVATDIWTAQFLLIHLSQCVPTIDTKPEFSPGQKVYLVDVAAKELENGLRLIDGALPGRRGFMGMSRNEWLKTPLGSVVSWDKAAGGH